MTVASTAFPVNRLARGLAIKTTFKDLRGAVKFLPQSIAVVGQGSTAATFSTTKAQVTSASDVGNTYGFGSPLHLAVKQLLPQNGDGVGNIPVNVYPLVDDGSGVVSDGDITPSGSATSQESYIVRVNEIDSEEFVIAVGASVATIVASMETAINAVLDMPIIAVDGTTLLTFTSKWKGVSANDIFVEVIGSTTAGVSFAVTLPTGGLVNPDIAAALAQVGSVWETMFLNCLDIADTTTLDLYDVFGEGRWEPETRKPCVVFTGNTEAVLATSVAVPDARPTDRTNSQLVAPGSNNLPFVVAARQLARIALLANNNPPHDYGSQDATGLVPGTDAEQWTSLERDVAIKSGSSSIQVKDGVINVSDVITFYKPTNEEPPAFRYVVDIVKLQQVIFNLNLKFDTPEWDGAPLIPDNQPTTNRSAKRPKSAVAVIAALIDQLALAAIISDPETAKQATIAQISEVNPKRLDICMQVQLSGNTNVKSIDLNFGFFFGTAAVV